MSGSGTSENSELSEKQFENIETSESKNEGFSDLIENLQEMRLEPYQFEPRKSNWSTFDKGEYDENEMQENSSLNAHEEFHVGNLKWCTCELCKSEYREIDCLCCKEVDAKSDENLPGSFIHYEIRVKGFLLKVYSRTYVLYSLLNRYHFFL